MRKGSTEMRAGLLVLLVWLLAWGATTLLIALLAPSFILAMLGLVLLNLLVLRLAWGSRTIPTGQDTEWADATRHPARTPRPVASGPARPPLPPLRPLRLMDQAPVSGADGACGNIRQTAPYLVGQPPMPGADGAVATARQTYIYDN